MKRFLLALVVLLVFCGAAFAEAGYVRLAINGTNVNLRPQPRAGGSVVAQMNTGDVFFAEKWPITCLEDDSQWYKIVLPAPERWTIKPLCDWDKRFKANVAFVNANFATISPLRICKNGCTEECGCDLNRIKRTPVGQYQGYLVHTQDPIYSISTMKEAGFLPFSPNGSVKNGTDIYYYLPSMGSDVIGRYEQGADVRIIGVRPEEPTPYYIVADPYFRKPVGFVAADDISIEPYKPEDGEKNFDWQGLHTSLVISVGGSLPEIVRRWGGGQVERYSYADLGGVYLIHNIVGEQDSNVKYYEWLPEPDGTIESPAILRFESFSTNRKGVFVCGIHLGHDNKDSIQKLMGEPDEKGKDDQGEYWNWRNANDLFYVYFDAGGIVTSVSLQEQQEQTED